LDGKGMVETVSSMERDGREVAKDLRWGVYVVIEAPNDYAAACFRQYGMNTDASGSYSAMYKPFHLIGLELNISVLSATLLSQPTGATKAFTGDVVATAKRDLKAGDRLDGEGGSTVWGKLMPAPASLKHGALPIGLADVPLIRDVAKGDVVRWDDVEIDDTTGAAAIRRAMERTNA
jgi:predicted homoserine dehydrogenase-like protein